MVEGTARPSRINDAEPQPTLAICEPPAFLDAYAKQLWNEHIHELHAVGCFSVLDRGTFACVCQAYARWRHAEEALAEFVKADPRFRGLVIRTKPSKDSKGGNTIQNPLVGIANRAAGDFVRYAGEFGMTPSARTRVRVEGAAIRRGDKSAEKYFTD